MSKAISFNILDDLWFLFKFWTLNKSVHSFAIQSPLVLKVCQPTCSWYLLVKIAILCHLGTMPASVATLGLWNALLLAVWQASALVAFQKVLKIRLYPPSTGIGRSGRKDFMRNACGGLILVPGF